MMYYTKYVVMDWVLLNNSSTKLSNSGKYIKWVEGNLNKRLLFFIEEVVAIFDDFSNWR